MDTSALEEMVEDLSGDIDDLEESLAPLLKGALSQSTSKLPLLDKAKAYVLATYALESVLFSSLRLNGVDAKSHPIFKELARVKEYFGKIKAAESAGSKRSTTLDKDAANRFIKHGLAGNDKYDRERAERMAAEKTGAKRKLEEMSVGTHTRFDGAAKRIKASESSANDSMATEKETPPGEASAGATAELEPSPMLSKSERKEVKRKRRLERRLRQLAELEASGNGDHESGLNDLPSSSVDVTGSTPKKKRMKRKGKAQKLEDETADEMK